MDFFESIAPFLVVAIASLGASLLTFFSGFGLGTILTPVFVLFFPPEIAIALTAIVHFLNNIFKTSLIAKHIHIESVLKFGIPSMIGAYFGALVLKRLVDIETDFKVGELSVNGLNVVLGFLILGFAFFEIIPTLKTLKIDSKWLLPGGIISGFFGGLSGHQGALRSAFLIKTFLNKEAFVATGASIALLVDTIRISVYAHSGTLSFAHIHQNIGLLTTALLAAFGGAMIGKRLLKKIKLPFIQKTVALFMMIISLLLIFNVI